MIVLAFKEGHNVPGFAKDIVSGYRWAFEVTWASIGFYHQYRSVQGGWHRGGRYYDLSLTRYLAWGRDHCYYDGPHDSFSLGFLHVNWSGAWCERCYAGA